ncbi:MAG: L,D-transpeptidase family protein [Desulfovibrio sp.]|nr:L,D-transpeptidase family protein [Desulfovibrio sp.]
MHTSTIRHSWCLLLFLWVFFFSFLRVPVLADNWQADLKETNLPPHFVAVDKEKRKFYFFEKHSPVQLKYEFPCMTGQIPGDKQIINDLKTPEGIYFIKSKISGGLDFKEYGGIAYPLNYPNPVDRLRGKTGHSIWIHSKGFGIVPTKGCVVIGLKDIDTVGPRLTPGTAVILAEDMHIPKVPAPSDQAEELCALMQEWSNAWAQRSAKMFDFYDQAAYSKATENFSVFRANKENIFKTIDSIKLYNRNIHALEGPGYWVTWSEQCYAATNHSTEGIRRLYWQRGEDQRFRIVGMEWNPQHLGMIDAFKNGTLVCDNKQVRTDASLALPPVHLPDGQKDIPRTPRQPLEVADLTTPLAPLQTPPSRHPAEFAWESGMGTERHIPQTGKLSLHESPLERPQPENESTSAKVGEKQHKNTTGEETREEKNTSAFDKSSPASSTGIRTPIKDPDANDSANHRENTGAGGENLVLANDDTNRVIALTQQFATALSTRNSSIETFFSQKSFNKVSGVPAGRSLKNELRRFEKLRNEPWLQSSFSKPTVERKGTVYIARLPLFIMGPNIQQEGEYTVFWHNDLNNELRIVGLRFTEGPLGLSASWLEKASAEITRDVTAWYKAWEAADINRYMEFYTDNALQQGRRGSKAIRASKEKLWQRITPTAISFTGLRIIPEKNGVKVDMTQKFSDTTGKTDQGIKTLFMSFNGTRWQILQEDWNPIPTH